MIVLFPAFDSFDPPPPASSFTQLGGKRVNVLRKNGKLNHVKPTGCFEADVRQSSIFAPNVFSGSVDPNVSGLNLVARLFQRQEFVQDGFVHFVIGRILKHGVHLESNKKKTNRKKSR